MKFTSKQIELRPAFGMCSWHSIVITFSIVHVNENYLRHKRIGGTWSNCFRFQSNSSFGVITIVTEKCVLKQLR
jgi:hypothetical protein